MRTLTQGPYSVRYKGRLTVIASALNNKTFVLVADLWLIERLKGSNEWLPADW